MIQGYTAPSTDEAVVKRSRLTELERKAKAHDIYLAATHRMRLLLAEIMSQPVGSSVEAHWREGYSAALSQWAELILEEGRRAD